MKAFKNKLIKTNKILLTIYILVLIEYIIGLIFFTRSVLLLNGVETLIRIIGLTFLYLTIIVYFIYGLVLLFTNKLKKFAIISVIIAILVPGMAYGSYLINTIYKEIVNITESDLITYTSKLIAKTNYKLDSGSLLGMIDDKDDIEGYELAKKLIDREKLSNEVKEYSDYYEMLTDLYNDDIDAIFVPNGYVTMFNSEETFANLDGDTYVIYSYEEKRQIADIVSTNKDLSEPFTILLVGVDSETESRLTSNADTIMLLTFNPRTLNATILSIPRDSYVPIPCRNNAYAKINSSAAKGISCVIETVEALTTIEIDYYITVNFRAVVDLVEALGGVSVDVQKPDFNMNHGNNCKNQVCEQDSKRRWGTNTIYITPGVQHLNGEQALAYSRNRGQYISSDFDRNKHQQQVLEQIAKEAKKIRSMKDFQEILNIIGKNIDTNLTTNNILSFYNLGKSIAFNNDSDFINIEKTYLETYSLPVYLTGIRGFTAAQGVYKSSLNEIIQAMKVNLELENQTLIKTFSYKYAENYELSVVGKNKRDNNKLETLPNFTGKSKDDVEAWCNSRSISITYQNVNEGDALYNPLYPTGYVMDQSVHSGILLADTNIKSITVYVMNNTSGNNPVLPPPTDDDDDDCDPIIDISCNPVLSP